MASLFDAVERPQVIINTNDFDKPKEPVEDHASNLQNLVDKLFGLHGQERYQLWPERLVRDAVSAPHDVMTGQIPTHEVDPITGEVHTSSGMIKAAQDVSALAGTGGLAGAGNEAGMALGVVPVDVAKKLNFKSSPISDVLKQAVGNTPSASIDADGHLVLKVLRNQLPDQEMSESVRGGVFYLPEGSKYARYYNGTTNNNYGGVQSIEGETAFKNPLVVKGQTGGKAPENAYTQITGDKKAFKNLENEVMEIVTASWMKKKDPQAYYDLVNRFLDKHAPEMRGYADHILDNSNKGNQLRYALQEAAIASAARKAGHDGIIGYSEGRGPNKGKPFLSEIFDVRENRYPSPDGDFSVHPSLYADSSKESAALQANRPFYSAVENAVAAAKQPKADAQQWLSFLKNQPGVKQEELAHLGLDKLSGSITKDELLKAVQEGQPQIKEVWKDHPDDAKDFDNETKYHSYQLPGGENYREMLLTLPVEGGTNKRVRIYNSDGLSSIKVATPEELERLRSTGRIKFDELEDVNPQTSYTSSHWDEPNVLAHIRMNDRNIDGKKSLHLEEIQSDWHQEGRKKGYESDFKIPDRTALEKQMDEIRALAPSDLDIMGKMQWLENQPKYVELRNEFNRQIPSGIGEAVPDAPFKKTWDELALKKAITHAVKNGYDSISWTPGEAQAARYDLSKHLDSIGYEKRGDNLYNVTARGKNGNTVWNNQSATLEQIESHLGKEMAEKIKNGNGDKQGKFNFLTDLDLKVGGQGMKAFYDKMLVDKMNALTKKHGGKVEKLKSKAPEFGVFQRINQISPDFPTAAEAREWGKANGYEGKATVRESKPGQPHEMWTVKITPDLREHVLKKGFPLFSAGVPTFSPIDYDPFKSKEK